MKVLFLFCAVLPVFGWSSGSASRVESGFFRGESSPCESGYVFNHHPLFGIGGDPCEDASGVSRPPLHGAHNTDSVRVVGVEEVGLRIFFQSHLPGCDANAAFDLAYVVRRLGGDVEIVRKAFVEFYHDLMVLPGYITLYVDVRARAALECAALINSTQSLMRAKQIYVFVKGELNSVPARIANIISAKVAARAASKTFEQFKMAYADALPIYMLSGDDDRTISKIHALELALVQLGPCVTKQSGKCVADLALNTINFLNN